MVSDPKHTAGSQGTTTREPLRFSQYFWLSFATLDILLAISAAVGARELFGMRSPAELAWIRGGTLVVVGLPGVLLITAGCFRRGFSFSQGLWIAFGALLSGFGGLGLFSEIVSDGSFTPFRESPCIVITACTGVVILLLEFFHPSWATILKVAPGIAGAALTLYILPPNCPPGEAILVAGIAGGLLGGIGAVVGVLLDRIRKKGT